MAAKITNEDGKIASIMVNDKNVTERKQAEADLRQSNEKFQQLVENLNDVIFMIDVNGVITYVSPPIETVLGYTPDELIKTNFVHLIYPDDLDMLLRAFNDVLKARISSTEYRIRAKSGKYPWVRSSSRPIHENGNVVGVQGVLTDITNQKQTETKLKESEEKYRLHFSQINDAIYSIDTGFNVLAVSPSVEKLIGYKPEELIGRPFQELNVLAPEYLGLAFSDISKIFSGKTINSSIYEFMAKDGTRKFGEVSAAPLIQDNKVAGSISVARDITERIQAEAAFRRSQKMLGRTEKIAHIGSWEWEIATDTVIWSEELFRIFQFDPDEGAPGFAEHSKLYHPEDFESLRQAVEDAIASGTPYELELRAIRKDGTTRICQAKGFVESGPAGQPERLFGFLHDITERKQIEDELRQAHKMEAVGNLAGGIAHELNNILSIIIGNTELAIDDIPDLNPAADSLQEIRIASLRAKEVVSKILSFARKMPTERKPIKIGATVRDSLKILRATIPAFIEIRQNILCKSEIILADQTEIHQILMNLCTNSAHAMKETSGVIEIVLEPAVLNDISAKSYEDVKPGQYVRLTVKDTGTGMQPELLDRILDPYFTTKDVDEGLGMGLAIVYGIVKRNDGAIKIESNVGDGTTVEVLFPVIEFRDEIKLTAPEEIPGGTERILVVDDEASLVKMVTQMLEQLGYEVVGKTSSTEALKFFLSESERFDLVITDMAMPEMPGDHLAQALMKIRPAIPIILCTGHSDRIDEKKAGEMGFACYYMKPFNKKAFAGTVRKILDEAKKTAQGE